VTIPADKLNGTFAYSAAEPEDQGKLTYDVTSVEKRKAGLDLKTALVWKDATAAENKYGRKLLRIFTTAMIL
jgi:hypothetical protein